MRKLLFIGLLVLGLALFAGSAFGKKEKKSGKKDTKKAGKEEPKPEMKKEEAAEQLDPEKVEMWKGDEPDKKTLKNMSQEEIKQRVCMKKIEDIRGLKFKAMVKFKSLPTKEFMEEFGDTSGMVKGPAGFYRYNDRTLYLNQDSPSKMANALRMHESIHALQHQLWGYEMPKTTDEYMRNTAVREGEATVIPWSLNPAMKAMMGGFVPGWLKDRDKLDQYNATNNGASMQTRTAFNYTVAAKFVEAVLENEGWDAVTKMYTDKKILSTEQVMHPEKYMDKDKWDAPTEFDFPNLPEEFGAPWKLTAQLGEKMHYNTLGEFEMMLKYLTCPLTGPKADSIAAGWDGDWYTVIADGDEGCEIWMTAWDTPADAEEWADAQIKFFENVQLPVFAKDNPKLNKIDMPEGIKPAFGKLGGAKPKAQLYEYKQEENKGHVYIETAGKYGIFIETTKVETLKSILASIAKKADKAAPVAKAEEPKKAEEAKKPEEGKKPEKVFAPDNWVKAYNQLNLGRFTIAEEMLQGDPNSMAAKLLERLKTIRQIEKFGRDGEYDKARNLVKELRAARKYNGACDILDDRINRAQENDEWPEED